MTERCRECDHARLAHGGLTGCVLCKCTIPYNRVKTRKEKPQ
jgi:hypothetical protein